MILAANLHVLLVNWLTNRPTLYPRRYLGTLPVGFIPEHLDCYGTARALDAHANLPVIAGVRFLDKFGKLFPWPHMVNAIGPIISDGLVDASPVPDQPDLGFVPILVNETSAWNEITEAYRSAPETVANGLSWNCRFADDLTERFMSILQQRVNCASWTVATVAVPASIPKAK